MVVIAGGNLLSFSAYIVPRGNGNVQDSLAFQIWKEVLPTPGERVFQLLFEQVEVMPRRERVLQVNSLLCHM